MMKFSLPLFVALSVFLCTNTTLAFTEEGVIASYSLLNFDYREFDDQGEQLLREHGYISGIKAEAKYSLDNIYVGGKFSFHGNKIGFNNLNFFNGEVSYDGQTQEGRDFETTTIETILNGEIEVGRIYESWRPHDYAVIYVGLGYHRWIRDIQNRKVLAADGQKLDSVAGLFEIYTWWYGSLGARGYLFRTKKFFLMIELNLLRTVFPAIDVNFKGVINKATGKPYVNQALDLGEHWGGKVTIPMRYHLTPTLYVNIEPFLEAWDLGRSPDVELVNAGGSISEPRSTTRFLGVNIGVQYLW